MQRGNGFPDSRDRSPYGTRKPAISDVGHDPGMAIHPHPSVVERLGRLALDQRAAATSPPGRLRSL